MAQGKRTVTDEEIVESIIESDDPAFTTAELAEMHAMSVEGMRNRLKALERDGRILSKKPGERSVIWWHESDQESPLAAQ